MADNVILNKSKAFALRIIKLYKYLVEQKCEYILSKQLLRCGTSIGANVKESAFAQSRADFTAKLFIAQKECAETEYWLELLYETNCMEEESYKALQNDCGAIRRMLISSLKTIKSK